MLVLLAACTSVPVPVVSAPPVHEAPVSTLPPPFSADKIRAAMPVGTKLLFALETSDGTRRQRWDVEQHAADTVGIRFTDLDANGKGDGGAVKTFKWTELEQHAHFPPGTTRERQTLNVFDRPMEGWRYHVAGPDGPAVFDFADVLPGPPVASPGMTLLGDTRL